MFQRLQTQLIFLFIAFVSLVVISVGVTYLGLQTQQQNALVINLAGRQRMLIQQMTRLALQAQDGDESVRADLQESEHVFSQTLSALQNGGPAPYLVDSVVNLPATSDVSILTALRDVESSWGQYRSTLDAVASATDLVSLQGALEEQSEVLVQRADTVTRLYETTSTAKVNRLRAIQVTFLFCALGLLAVGAWMTRHSLLKPLQALQVAAKRFGENQLDAPIQVEGPEEMRALSQAFDEMRSRLHTARGELIQLNTTLEQRVAQRTRELDALSEVSREITSQLDVRNVLNSVTEKVRVLLGGDSAMLCLLGEKKQRLHLQAMNGLSALQIDREYISTVNQASAVLTSRQALVCSDTQCVGGCGLLSDTHAASHVVAPLRIGDNVIGALCVSSSQPNHFSKESADVVTKLANTAAVALQNAQLYAQAERVAMLEERHRLAAEMHDGLGQTLSYLGLMTDQASDLLAEGRGEAAFERLQKTRETIEQTTGDVRRAINDLMDESLRALDLRTRLQNTLAEFEKEANLSVHWQVDTAFTPDCPRQVAEQVLNVTREALKNVASHAEAKHVTARLGKNNGHYFISIEDDGIGFDTSQPEPSGHFGLQIMLARAAHIGGELIIHSAPGAGSRVMFTFPNAGSGE